jgi:DNA invertase Pin-like site-specific DNA recombinase
MKTIADLRVSQDPLDMQAQKQSILTFAQNQSLKVSRFIALSSNWRKGKPKTKGDELLQRLDSGDTLVVSSLSDIGHSIGQILITVDTLIRHGVRFIAVSDSIDSALQHKDLSTQVTVDMCQKLAKMEKELISRRTKQGLAKAVANGKRLGRPKGSLGKSRLDSRRREIKKLLALGVSKASIAKITGVSQSAVSYYIKSRKLA